MKSRSWTEGIWKPEMESGSRVRIRSTHIMARSAMLSAAMPRIGKVRISSALNTDFEAFYTNNANGRRLLPRRKRVRIVLSMNAYYMIGQGMPITIVIPKKGAVLSIDAVAIMKGSKKADVLGNNGFINAILLNLGIVRQPIQFMFTTFGVVVALVHVTMPVMVIMLAAALSHIDRDYQRAAESLGAGPVSVFLTVTLPLSMPGVVAGVTTAFAWTFSAFATPQLIGGGRVNMISNLVYQLGFASFNFPFAASLCVSGLALTIVVLSVLRLASRRLETIEPH